MRPGQWRVMVLLVALLAMEMIINPGVKQWLYQYWPGFSHFFPSSTGTQTPPTSTFNNGGTTVTVDNQTGCATIKTATGVRKVC